MLVKEAEAITGGIGGTRKTGISYGLPALVSCRMGCKLAKEKNSVCSKCYGKQGNYVFYCAKTAHARRLASVKNVNPQWVDAMVTLISRSGSKYFRWHDTGDIISEAHIAAIFAVCRKTPSVKHWLPTKERETVNTFLSKGNIRPSNLCIRFSGYFVDENYTNNSVPVANVYKNSKPKGKICKAVLNHKSCAENNCRACWNVRCKNVCYKYHN